MKERLNPVLKKIKSVLFYCGSDKEEFGQVKQQVAEANLKALKYWSVLVSFFWIYCIVMSFRADDYRMCRPAYIISLSLCIFSYLCSRFLATRFPNTISLFKFIFRLSLLGGGVGIAVCQWNLRSLTMFAVGIISPSIFIDSAVSSLAVHCSALVLYIVLGRNTIAPDIYSWGLGNYILFSIFGLLIGYAINKERFERYTYAESEKVLAEIQKQYAYYDRMTGLQNRRAYEEKLHELSKDAPAEFCIIMADINGLKETNDTLGHDAGDELIIGSSLCLSEAFNRIDTIYRIGGDEFCIIMPGSAETAQNCIAKLEELSTDWQGRYIERISIAIGFASNKEYNKIDDISAVADKNMYENKRTYYMNRGDSQE